MQSTFPTSANSCTPLAHQAISLIGLILKSILLFLCVYELFWQGQELGWINLELFWPHLYDICPKKWLASLDLAPYTSQGVSSGIKAASWFHQLPRLIILGGYLSFWAGVKLLRNFMKR